jgi:hypothetical protein
MTRCPRDGDPLAVLARSVFEFGDLDAFVARPPLDIVAVFTARGYSRSQPLRRDTRHSPTSLRWQKARRAFAARPSR